MLPSVASIQDGALVHQRVHLGPKDCDALPIRWGCMQCRGGANPALEMHMQGGIWGCKCEDTVVWFAMKAHTTCHAQYRPVGFVNLVTVISQRQVEENSNLSTTTLPDDCYLTCQVASSEIKIATVLLVLQFCVLDS